MNYPDPTDATGSWNQKKNLTRQDSSLLNSQLWPCRYTQGLKYVEQLLWHEVLSGDFMGIIMGICYDNAAVEERKKKQNIKIPISLYSSAAASLEGLIFALKRGVLELMTSTDCHLSPRATVKPNPLNQ